MSVPWAVAGQTDILDPGYYDGDDKTITGYLSRIEKYAEEGLGDAKDLSGKITNIQTRQYDLDKITFQHSVLLDKVTHDQEFSSRRLDLLEEQNREQSKLNTLFANGMQKSLLAVEEFSRWKWLLLGSLFSFLSAAGAGLFLHYRSKKKRGG